MDEDGTDTDRLMAQMLAITSTDLFGASLNAASAQSRLSATSLGCANCAQQKACSAWVQNHSGQRLPAPAFCDNRHLLGPSTAHF